MLWGMETKFEVTGSVPYSYSHITKALTLSAEVSSVLVFGEFPTAEEAKAFAAQFPKSWKVVGAQISGGKPGVSGFVSCRAGFGESKTHGAQNETGLARIRKFLARVPHQFVTDSRIGNAATAEQLEAFLK